MPPCVLFETDEALCVSMGKSHALKFENVRVDKGFLDANFRFHFVGHRPWPNVLRDDQQGPQRRRQKAQRRLERRHVDASKRHDSHRP